MITVVFKECDLDDYPLSNSLSKQEESFDKIEKEEEIDKDAKELYEWNIFKKINTDSLKIYLNLKGIKNIKFIDDYITQAFYRDILEKVRLRKIEKIDYIILTAAGEKHPSKPYPKWFSSLEEAVSNYLDTFLSYVASLKDKGELVLLWINEPEKSYNPETDKYNIYSRFIVMKKADCKKEFLIQLNQIFDLNYAS